MPQFNLISSERLAVLLCLCAMGGGVKSAFAQQYRSLSGAVSYTEVTPNPYPSASWPGRGTQPVGWPGTIHQTFTVASQPVVTSVQFGEAYSPPQVPLPTSDNSPPNPLADGPFSVSPESGLSMYYSGASCPECTDSQSGRSCDWLCRTQKKLRSVCRAGQRRSECQFEYPVSTPSGSPYGYVEPTWSQFGPQPSAYPIGPNY